MPQKIDCKTEILNNIKFSYQSNAVISSQYHSLYIDNKNKHLIVFLQLE